MNSCGSKRLIVVALLGGWSSIVGASGFQLQEQNAAGIGNSFAGSAAVSENAGTVFYNPAGMTKLKDREVSVGMSSTKSNIKFGNSNSIGAAGNHSDGGNAGDWVHTPNIYASWAVTKDIYLGLGINRPFGFKSEYEGNWVGSAQGTKFELETVNVNPSIAYRVNEKLSLGLGLNWQKLDTNYERRYSTLPGQENISRRIDVDDSAWGWNVGMLYSVSDSMRIGLAYRSKIKYEVTGNLSLASDGSAAGNAALAGLSAQQGNVKADIDMPDTFTLSVYQKLSDRWEMMGDISRTGWGSVDNVNFYYTSGANNGVSAERLDGHYRNTWRVAVGANYKYTDAWKFKYGIAYEQSPINDDSRRSAYMPDNNRLWLSFGVQWLPTRDSRLDLGVAYQYIKDADVDVDLRGQNRGYLRGDYDLSQWVLGAQYSVGF